MMSFLKTLIKNLKTTYDLKSSVWITGLSNGGMMSENGLRGK